MLNMTSSLLQHHGSCQGGTTRRNVNHGSTRKIKGTHFSEHTIRVPAPVCQRRVNQKGEQYDEQYIGSKTNTFGYGSNHQPGRYNSKHQLEEGK